MIYWFSGTGNSEHVAKCLAAETGERLVSMAECVKNGAAVCDVRDGERLGFVFPVYFYGLPSIVNDFLALLKAHTAPDTYVYCVLTCGGSTGNADEMLRGRLKEMHLPLTASFAVKMPDNYILLYEPQSGDEVKAALEHSEKALQRVVSRVVGRVTGADKSVRGFAPKTKTALFYGFYALARRTKPFRADKSCIGCGKCESICPTKTIKITDGRPTWTVPTCALCLACLHRCPQTAIQYGHNTVGRARYTNPHIDE